jgi:hypothetical protein
MRRAAAVLLVTGMIGSGASASAADDLDTIRGCQSAARGGSGGALRALQPGATCLSGETPVHWPATTLVFRDAAGDRVGLWLGFQSRTPVVALRTGDGGLVGVQVKANRLLGTSPSPLLRFTQIGCIGPTYLREDQVTDGAELPALPATFVLQDTNTTQVYVHQPGGPAPQNLEVLSQQGYDGTCTNFNDGFASLVPVVLVDTDPANPRPPFTAALE